MDHIEYIDRQTGEKLEEKVPGGSSLRFLYSKPLGKLSLFLLIKRKIFSAIGGMLMNTAYSAKKIDGFVADYGIDMNEYMIPQAGFKHFNDFFYRKIKVEARPVSEQICSPADGKILAFPSLSDVSKFFVKGSEFDLKTFLRNDELAKKYVEGAMAIIRLAPPDYHRFHFPAAGRASKMTRIKGWYYSVSPLALRKSLRIFLENKREFCTLTTEQYGDVLIIDVGATLTGSIIQTFEEHNHVKAGQEKGYFAFGGSTTVLLFEKNKVRFDTDLVGNTQAGLETTIKMGEQIAGEFRQ